MLQFAKSRLTGVHGREVFSHGCVKALREIRDNIELITSSCAPEGEEWNDILQTVWQVTRLAAEVSLSETAQMILRDDMDTLYQMLTTNPDGLELSADEADRWLCDLTDHPQNDAFATALRLYRLLGDQYAYLAEQLTLCPPNVVRFSGFRASSRTAIGVLHSFM